MTKTVYFVTDSEDVERTKVFTTLAKASEYIANMAEDECIYLDKEEIEEEMKARKKAHKVYLYIGEEHSLMGSIVCLETSLDDTTF